MAARERLICASDALADGGTGIRFEVKAEDVPLPAFVVRFGGKVQAYFNRCGHMPLELDWQRGRFFDTSGLYLVCATHGALYAPESGRCLGGRCDGKGLVSVPVFERDGGIYLIERE